MNAVVVSHGDTDPSDRAWLGDADLIVAADGGAATLGEWGARPHRVIGDLDSLVAAQADRLREGGVSVERRPVDKDQSDTELALEVVLQAGAERIVILGALGGAREDHALANVLLLADPRLQGRDVRIVRGGTTVRLLRAGERLALDAPVGSLMTLLPIGGDATGITTEGLRWPLDGGTLYLGRSRGLSNVVERSPAAVRCEAGTLLVIETAV